MPNMPVLRAGAFAIRLMVSRLGIDTGTAI